MKKILLVGLVIGVATVLGFYFGNLRRIKEVREEKTESGWISLPEPQKKGKISLEEAILKRRSRRDFAEKPLTLAQLSQILWAAQGVTDEETGFRTAPSAGALYPLEIYVVVKTEGVEGLEGGVYYYCPEGHGLQLHLGDYTHQDLVAACLGQGACEQAPVSLVVAAEYERTTGKYGERGERYVHMEAGHVSQNIYLQVESLGLGTVTIGAFIDEEMSRVLNLPLDHKPLYIMPLGLSRS